MSPISRGLRPTALLTIAAFLPSIAAAGEAPPAPAGGSLLEVAPELVIHAPGALEARRQPRLQRFFARHSGRWEVRWDTRGDRPHLIQGPGIPLLSGRPEQLSVDGARGPAEPLRQVERQLRRFLTKNPELFGVAPEDLRLDHRRSFGSGDGLWLIEFEQLHGGLPVAGARIFLRLVQGRLVQLGSHRLAEVDESLDLEPALSAEQAFERARGELSGKLELVASAGLAIHPAAPAGEAQGESYLGAPGQGYRHRLAWRLTAGTPDGGSVDGARGFDLVVDAHSGELLASRDLVRSVERQVLGEVAPVRRDQPAEEVAFPWVRVFNSGQQYTDAEGRYDYQGGSAMTKLEGLHVAAVADGCGRIELATGDGELDFGGGGGDCQTSGFGGPGNTRAARTAYYYLSLAQERAASYLGHPPGLRGDALIARTNLPGDGCGAYYNQLLGTVDLERSTASCANPGELPGIVLHEFGHHVFSQSPGAFADGAAGEAAADTFSFLETGEPCIGHGFRPGVACHGCSRSCTGVRDLDAFALGGGATLARPDTVMDDEGLDCDRLVFRFTPLGRGRFTFVGRG